MMKQGAETLKPDAMKRNERPPPGPLASPRGDTLPADTVRLRLTLRGAVQGVGFRPFVFRLAHELQLAGWVKNSPQGVFMQIEGPREALENFLLRLDREKPPQSAIQSLEASWLEPVGYTGFEIRESETGGDKTALVLPDIATCPDCLREIFDPTNRRYRYPFTNCTHCGPRFSLIEALPYDRANTTMKSFAMCPQCQAEYADPANRRFHAQPNACPVCGPQLELWSASGEVVWGGDDALRAAAQAIRRGKIVAVKGLGGFHLMADARSEPVVRLLRERKRREEKPFALLFPSLESVKTVCEVSPMEERLLCSPEAPIVLLRRRNPASNDNGLVAPAVAPGNPNLGVMLPSNPLHHLLMAALNFPVVATSGNVSDEPICTDEHEALQRLGGIADVFLVHNRPIARHVDDSIVRVLLGRELVLRRARGFAPLPIEVRSAAGGPREKSAFPLPHAETILAVGAHLKNAVALSVGHQVFLSQHIGDLETEAANNVFRRVIADFEKFYDANPRIVVADWHPDYPSTRYAQARARQSNGPRGVGVQHHLAHVFSCLADNELEPPVLGVAWDGTGYGPDGMIWGGEFFLVTASAAERVAHWRPFRLPGGDKAVREPRRPAIGLLYELFGEAAGEMKSLPPLRDFSPVEIRVLQDMLRRGLNSPFTTSVGRLFDAVAALAGLRQTAHFEGQAAMELEFAIGGLETDEVYETRITERWLPKGNCSCASERRSALATRPPCLLDWAPMIRAILRDREMGVPVAKISAKFHNTLAETVVAVAKNSGQNRVLLSGGCFQNRYLTERVVRRLREENYQPYWHRRVPPNDGGMALGQVIAAQRQTD